ncbi:winged helix-turn-helix domain-containing protein [Falsiroseomonas oryzae]|uniref:winged helix-turn-helix domain-containing protein n=1 Tax=Falsiroseomonas oryzae TaxID=2766473 RepID=UPI0022EA8A61|nr:response regulator transcription factor [Roseomonas sp. MO-31]
MAPRIILIDANRDEGTGLAAYLGRHGLATETWTTPEPLLQRLVAHPPSLIVLHRRLRLEPDLGTLRRLRAASTVPVILRAMDADDEVDRVLALEIGADDYVPSGTSARELLARIRTVLRRARGGLPITPEARSGWRLCLKQRELFAPDGSARNLTSTEFELMQILARQQGAPVQRDALSLAVLRRPYHPEDRALDNLILRLRRKLGDDGASARLIKSVRGVGYVFTGFDAGAAFPVGHVEAELNGHHGPFA